MTHIEQAIRDAVEKGGYSHKDYNLRDDFDYVMQCDGAFEKFLLDPAFWQALGKARGWDEGLHEDETYIYAPVDMEMWKWKWHRFIDTLAEGKSAEQFFQELDGGTAL